MTDVSVLDAIRISKDFVCVQCKKVPVSTVGGRCPTCKVAHRLQTPKICEKCGQEFPREGKRKLCPMCRTTKTGLQLPLAQRKEIYRQLFNRQDGRCAICDEAFDHDGGEVGHIDHNHENGKIRGLLCHACNVGLGMFKDDHKRLTKAIMFLKRKAG